MWTGLVRHVTFAAGSGGGDHAIQSAPDLHDRAVRDFLDRLHAVVERRLRHRARRHDAGRRRRDRAGLGLLDEKIRGVEGSGVSAPGRADDSPQRGPPGLRMEVQVRFQRRLDREDARRLCKQMQPIKLPARGAFVCHRMLVARQEEGRFRRTVGRLDLDQTFLAVRLEGQDVVTRAVAVLC